VTRLVHPQGICESTDVGDHVYIENDVVVGDRVTVKNGVRLWDGLRVGDDVCIGPNATFTNDPFPRSRVYGHEIAVTRIETGASIGANATILPGLTIGARHGRRRERRHSRRSSRGHRCR
jgi:acetyltransferase-like isoleucine patch superfamily enzyme